MFVASSLLVVTITVEVRGRPRASSSWRIDRSASRPFITGMLMSMQIRSYGVSIFRASKAFVESAPCQVMSLREHLAARDAVSARRDAHGLKGSAATVSALAPRQLAMGAERAASGCSWDILEKLIPQVEVQLACLGQAIAEAADPGVEIPDGLKSLQ